MNSRRLTRAPIYDDETRLSDDLAQSALAIAASRLRVPNRVIFPRSDNRLATVNVTLFSDVDASRPGR